MTIQEIKDRTKDDKPKDDKVKESFNVCDKVSVNIDYVVPSAYVSALIYGEMDGLSDEDEKEIDDFVEGVIAAHGNANFMLADDKDLEVGFKPSNDVNNKGADCMLLHILPTK